MTIFLLVHLMGMEHYLGWVIYAWGDEVNRQWSVNTDGWQGRCYTGEMASDVCFSTRSGSLGVKLSININSELLDGEHHDRIIYALMYCVLSVLCNWPCSCPGQDMYINSCKTDWYTCTSMYISLYIGQLLRSGQDTILSAHIPVFWPYNDYTHVCYN